MISNILKLLTFFFIVLNNPSFAEVIWRESFSIPEKGVWGDDLSIDQDFSGISSWEIDFSKIKLSDIEDYAKTVSTSGGRFECRDINGEVVWKSVEISIEGYNNVNVNLIASETGSGANAQNKYLKAYYKLDDGEEVLFSVNGENIGNWGSVQAEQNDLEGDKLQIIVYMNNHYSADKVILDEVVISGLEEDPIIIEQGDLLLNEVLFNPFTDGSDYIEIYNNSNQQIPIKHFVKI